MRFGGVVAVDGVDFTLAEGELRCLIGPNGAGKSTFFKMPDRPAPADRRARSCCAAATSPGIEPHAIARLGIGIKTQVPDVFDGLTVRGERVARRPAAGWRPAQRRRRADAATLERLGIGAHRRAHRSASSRTASASWSSSPW